MQITKIAAILSLVLPVVLADGQASGAIERRCMGGAASAASLSVRNADAAALAQRSPKKKKGGEPLIKANKGQSQAEQDKITAFLDRKNNPSKRSPSPKKKKDEEPLIKANKGQSQAEEDAITAFLDKENNPSKWSPTPKKKNGEEPLIKANKGQSQAEEDKITAELDAENNPQPPARAAQSLEGLRG